MDHYTLLGLRQEQSRDNENIADELKRAYKRALLFHHPDKQHSRPQHDGSPSDSSATSTSRSSASAISIDQISLAYSTLADPAKRAEYDRLLLQQQQEQCSASKNGLTRHTGIETVDLSDLECDEATGVWTRHCRCGNVPAFVLTEQDLEDHVDLGEVTLGCKGCSLWLKVLYSVDD